jgi:hypothetical protein
VTDSLLQEVAVPIDTIPWFHVPPGTQLEVSVGPQGGAFISGGDIFMLDKGLLPVKQWSDAQLRPGPAIEPLKAGVDYIVDIRIAPASATAVSGLLSAALKETSSGRILDQADSPFSLTQGTHQLVRIFADADPLVPPVTAPTPRGRLARARNVARSPQRKKRGR